MSSKQDREAQRRSFAYGNTAIENPRVTRQMVDEQAEKLAEARRQSLMLRDDPQEAEVLAWLEAAGENMSGTKHTFESVVRELREGLQNGTVVLDRGALTVIAKAIEVIGDEQEAMRWLATPLRVLDHATPISRLDDEQGQTDVLRVLTQLEHGVL